MPDVFNIEGSEREKQELVQNITKVMSPYKDCVITKDDLYDTVADQFPDDFQLIYSIKNEEKPILTVRQNAEDRKVEGIKDLALKAIDYSDRVGMTWGEYIFLAGFREQKNPKNPNVKSGNGQITIYKKLDIQ